jgi:hypothetical protein
VTQPDPIPPGQDTSSDVIQQDPPPFADADEFALAKVVNQVQLQDELVAALEVSVLISIKETDPNLAISDANPAVLYISPSGQDQSKVYDVINSHVPYTAYDQPEADRNYSAVVQNVVDNTGHQLSDDEMQTAIKGLLLKANTASELSLDQQLPSQNVQ